MPFSGVVLLVAVGCLLAARAVQGQVPPPMDPLAFKAPDPSVQFKDISIEQNLNAQVPLDLKFMDETGKWIQLGDYVGDRPAVLALVYYECPMLCNEVLNGLEVALKAMKISVGTDFDVITVSIDPGETPELAASKKRAHINRLAREGADEGWHFLTGPAESIDTLADIVGYRYAYDANTDQYAHAAGIMVLSRHGKVARYYYGVDYIPRDLEFGLVEASKGNIGNLVKKIVLLCFAYDPATGKYGFYVIGAMRVGAVLTVLAILGFWLAHWLQGRRRRRKTLSAGH